MIFYFSYLKIYSSLRIYEMTKDAVKEIYFSQIIDLQFIFYYNIDINWKPLIYKVIILKEWKRQK